MLKECRLPPSETVLGGLLMITSMFPLEILNNFSVLLLRSLSSIMQLLYFRMIMLGCFLLSFSLMSTFYYNVLAFLMSWICLFRFFIYCHCIWVVFPIFFCSLCLPLPLLILQVSLFSSPLMSPDLSQGLLPFFKIFRFCFHVYIYYSLYQFSSL